MIAPDTAQVFGDDCAHQPRFNICGQLLPCGTVKIAAAPSVVGVMDTVCIASVVRIGLEVTFLVDDAVAVANQFVVPGETLI